MTDENRDGFHNTNPKSFERTGEKSFVVEHEDGSQFHGEVDHKERFPSELSSGKVKPPSSGKSFGMSVCLRSDCITDRSRCGDCKMYSLYKTKGEE